LAALDYLFETGLRTRY